MFSANKRPVFVFHSYFSSSLLGYDVSPLSTTTQRITNNKKSCCILFAFTFPMCQKHILLSLYKLCEQSLHFLHNEMFHLYDMLIFLSCIRRNFAFFQIHCVENLNAIFFCFHEYNCYKNIR